MLSLSCEIETIKAKYQNEFLFFRVFFSLNRGFVVPIAESILEYRHCRINLYMSSFAWGESI